MEKLYPFSNGSEFSSWESINCDRCVKSSHIIVRNGREEYTKFRCAVQRDLIRAYWSDGKVNKRVYDICQQRDCPYRLEKRKKYAKKDNLEKLF